MLFNPQSPSVQSKLTIKFIIICCAVDPGSHFSLPLGSMIETGAYPQSSIAKTKTKTQNQQGNLNLRSPTEARMTPVEVLNLHLRKSCQSSSNIHSITPLVVPGHVDPQASAQKEGGTGSC